MAPPDAAVQTPVYDGATASSPDVVKSCGGPFPAALAGPAAAGLWSLRSSIIAARTTLTNAQTAAEVDWVGPHQKTFATKCSDWQTSAKEVEDALEILAKGLARAWQAAHGQQQRVCAARAFAYRESQESGLEQFGESIFGGEEHHPPGDPDLPGPDGFRATATLNHEDGCGHGGGSSA